MLYNRITNRITAAVTLPESCCVCVLILLL